MLSLQKLSGILSIPDKTKVAFDRYKGGHNKVIIIAPGFFNNKDTFLIKKTRDFLANDYDVVIFDFRGHGKSSGLFSWAAKEAQDLNAVVDYTNKYYDKIGILAFSLGASVSIIVSAKRRDIGSLALVSAVSDFDKIDYQFWKKEMLVDLRDNFGIIGKGKGVRPGNIFLKKEKAIDKIGLIENIPILFIHGDKDWVIAPRHSEDLFKKTIAQKKIFIIKGGLHAEKLIDQYPKKMKEIILDWFNNTL